MSDRTAATALPGRRGIARWIWTGAFVLGCGIGGGILNEMKFGELPFRLPLAVAILVVLSLLALAMIREVSRNAAAKGCATEASRNYNRRARVWAIGYIVAIFGALWIFRNFAVPAALLWPLAFLPSVPILYLIWSMGRYLVEETDEYQRSKFTRAAMVATGVLLSVATVWGFFENFGLVPHAEAWMAVPIWALGLGLGQCLNRLSDHGGDEA